GVFPTKEECKANLEKQVIDSTGCKQPAIDAAKINYRVENVEYKATALSCDESDLANFCVTLEMVGKGYEFLKRRQPTDINDLHKVNENLAALLTWQEYLAKRNSNKQVVNWNGDFTSKISLIAKESCNFPRMGIENYKEIKRF